MTRLAILFALGGIFADHHSLRDVGDGFRWHADAARVLAQSLWIRSLIDADGPDAAVFSCWVT